MEILVNFDVDDVERAVAFYRDGLGLSVGRRFDDGFVEMVGASSRIYLLRRAAGSRANAAGAGVRTYERHWTPVHLDFVVDDIEATVARCVAAGGVLEVPIRDDPYGRIAMLADPFGHGFCVIEFEGRGYDTLLERSASAPGGNR